MKYLYLFCTVLFLIFCSSTIKEKQLSNIDNIYLIDVYVNGQGKHIRGYIHNGDSLHFRIHVDCNLVKASIN